MLAEERQSAPNAPPDNILRLGLPALPRRSRTRVSVDLRNLPKGVVPLRHPGPTQEESVKAVLSPEMEAIFALIYALDERTPSGKQSARSVRDRVIARLSLVNVKGDRRMADKALERLVTMKWWEHRPC